MTIELKQVHEEMCKTFEALKEENKKTQERADALSIETRDKVNAELTELRNELKTLQIKAKRPDIPNRKEDGLDDETRELQKRAFDNYIRYGHGETAKKRFTEQEQRALSSLSDADGGFLVPPDLESGIIMNAYDMEEIRPYCNVGTTGRDVVMLGSLSKPSVAWGRTNIAVSAQDLTVGAERISIFDLRALTLIHNNTLEDSDADIFGELTNAFSRAMAEAEDDAFAIGAGDDSPKGIISDTRVQAHYTASGVAAALTDSTHDGVTALNTLIYSLKKTYRKNGVWLFNSGTEAVLRVLAYDNIELLWQPPKTATAPPTFMGYPIANPESMPDIGAGTFPIVFGDCQAGYKIRDRQGMSVQRLVERYAEYDQTGLLVKKRTGGMVTLDEAFVCMKIATS